MTVLGIGPGWSRRRLEIGEQIGVGGDRVNLLSLFYFPPSHLQSSDSDGNSTTPTANSHCRIRAPPLHMPSLVQAGDRRSEIGGASALRGAIGSTTANPPPGEGAAERAHNAYLTCRGKFGPSQNGCSRLTVQPLARATYTATSTSSAPHRSSPPRTSLPDTAFATICMICTAT
jgi:hypothetical protein